MERPISDMASVVNQVLSFVRGSGQEMEIAQVERRFLPMVMAVGRAALRSSWPRKGQDIAVRRLWTDRVSGVRISVTEAVCIVPSSARSP